MVVDSDYSYISGFGTQSVYGQPWGGSLDAILIKLYLANASVVWVRQIGGSGGEWGGTARTSLLASISTKGIAVVSELDMVLFSIAFSSANITGLPNPGYTDVAVAVYSRNGTFLKYMLDYIDDLNYHNSFDLVYSSAN